MSGGPYRYGSIFPYGLINLNERIIGEADSPIFTQVSVSSGRPVGIAGDRFVTTRYSELHADGSGVLIVNLDGRSCCFWDLGPCTRTITEEILNRAARGSLRLSTNGQHQVRRDLWSVACGVSHGAG